MKPAVVRKDNEIKFQNMFKVVVCTYNTEQFIDRCIKSIKSQNYHNFRCFIINDGSTDNTLKVAENAIDGDDRFTVINENMKHCPLESLYKHLPNICMSDHDIVVLIDGDDWLYQQNVFNILNSVYQEHSMMLTYGQYITSDNMRIGCNKPIDDISKIREPGVNFSHLKTFKYVLWKNIQYEDLCTKENSILYPMAGDIAFMLPMVEMAGLNRICYIDYILYMYNNEGGGHEDKQNARKQEAYDMEIRKKPPYRPIQIGTEIGLGEKRVIKECIENGNVVIDVGANSGTWIHEVLSMYPRIVGHCFEPIVGLKDYLEWVVRGRNVRVNMHGLFSSKKQIEFFHYGKIPVLSTMYRRSTEVEQKIIDDVPNIIEVPVMRLDEYCTENKIARINFLKIDVEGSELDVLIGASSMIENGEIDYIQFEYGECTKDANISLKQLFDAFANKPYKLYKIGPYANDPSGHYTGAMEDYALTNFLAVRNK